MLAELSAIASPTVNDEAIALFHAMGTGMRVYSGEEAVALITHSERAYMDLLLALDFAPIWSVKVVVRKWANVPMESEFRYACLLLEDCMTLRGINNCLTAPTF